MGSLAPRIVIVTRETDYQGLLARHATRLQARFFLEQRRQSLEDLEEQDAAFRQALKEVKEALPEETRLAQVTRSELDRFHFAPDDLVVSVGQDGLVANVAKYLDGQIVFGVNPAPDRYDGLLAKFSPDRFRTVLAGALKGEVDIERRTMVQARLDDGRGLVALNEIFLGHRSHQSARYRIAFGEESERQSSSGLIVASGTGATGWAASIARERVLRLDVDPDEARALFFVREAFPSGATGTDVTFGAIEPSESLVVISEMNDNGVIFGDGIEADHLSFDWGRRVEIRVADRALRLACP
jgi:NAD kinase